MDTDFDKLLSEVRCLVKNKKVLTEYMKISGMGCAIMSESGKIYTGINIEADCGIGFCAEHSAIADMLKNGETRILKIVAASSKGIRPPCGRCREFMRMIDNFNFDALVMIDTDRVVKLEELLPSVFVKVGDDHD
jgi:cytidine deaminase